MSDESVSPSPPMPVPPPPLQKDRLFPLLDTIQSLLLWGQKEFGGINFDGTNSYAWPPLPAGPVDDADHYKTFFIIEFDRVMDWNMPAPRDAKALDTIAAAIKKYADEMKSPTGAQ